MVRLKTGRLILRSLRPSDLDAVHTAADDQRILRNMLLPRNTTRQLTLNFLRRARRDERSGAGIHLAITRQDGDEIIGAVSLMNRNADHRHAELGYWIAVRYWRRGYGREAVERAVKYGFKEMNLNKIWATTVLTNKASAGLLKSVGFKHQGVLQQHAKVRGRWWDLDYWELLKRGRTSRGRK